MSTFDGLHSIAKNQLAMVAKGEPPDTGTGVDAITVSVVLFDWISGNATDAQKVDVARRVAAALNLEEP